MHYISLILFLLFLFFFPYHLFHPIFFLFHSLPFSFFLYFFSSFKISLYIPLHFPSFPFSSLSPIFSLLFLRFLSLSVPLFSFSYTFFSSRSFKIFLYLPPYFPSSSFSYLSSIFFFHLSLPFLFPSCNFLAYNSTGLSIFIHSISMYFFSHFFSPRLFKLSLPSLPLLTFLSTLLSFSHLSLILPSHALFFLYLSYAYQLPCLFISPYFPFHPLIFC